MHIRRGADCYQLGEAATPRRAADRVRTGDLHLGKVTRYQLRYNRKDALLTPSGGPVGLEPHLVSRVQALRHSAAVPS